MNRKAVVSAVMAMCLASSGLSFAQGHGGRNDQGRDGPGRHAQGPRNGPPGHRAMPVRQPDYRSDQGRHLGQYGNRGQMQKEAMRAERGAGPDHQFYRGGRLPVQYRTHQYVVDDWRGHHLTAPPRGYHWVQTGGDYVLVAIATGIILQLLLNN